MLGRDSGKKYHPIKVLLNQYFSFWMEEDGKAGLSRHARFLVKAKLTAMYHLRAESKNTSVHDDYYGRYYGWHYINTLPHPHLIKAKLDDPVTVDQKTMSCAEWLSMRRTDTSYLALQVRIILLTFPLSVPILILTSALNVDRQTYQFWKTDGEVLVERIRRIPTSPPPPSDDSSGDVSATSTSPAVMPPFSTFSTSATIANTLEIIPSATASVATSSPLETVAGANPSTASASATSVNNFGIFGDMRFVCSNLEAMHTGYPELRQYQIKLVDADEPDLPQVIQANLKFELKFTSPTDKPHWYSPEALATLRNDPSADLKQGLIRHLSVQFFTEIPPIRHIYEDAPFAPKALSALAAPEPQPAATAIPESTPTPTSSTSSFSLRKWWSAKKPEPAVPTEPSEEELCKMSYQELISKNYYHRAADKASNLTELTDALALNIDDQVANYGGIFAGIKSTEKDLKYQILHNDLEYAPSTRQRLEKLQVRLKEKLQYIHQLVNELPDQFWLHSTLIKEITALFRAITDLILERRIEEAFAMYETTIIHSWSNASGTTVSRHFLGNGFLDYAVPHLIIWNKQIRAILMLLRYEIKRYPQPARAGYSIWHIHSGPQERAHNAIRNTHKLLNHHPALATYAAYFNQHTEQVFRRLSIESIQMENRATQECRSPHERGWLEMHQTLQEQEEAQAQQEKQQFGFEKTRRDFGFRIEALMSPRNEDSLLPHEDMRALWRQADEENAALERPLYKSW